MPPKSVNSKKAAAMEKKAANEADKAARKAAEDERREAATWAEGADGRSAKRRDEQERKAQERDAKKAELKALMEAEEAAAAGKPKIKKPAGKNAGKANELKELEAQLKAMELAKKQKEEKRKAAAAATKAAKKKAAAGGLDDDYSSEDDLPPLEANPNRAMADVEQARSMEAAIDLLGGSKDGSAEKHPEKRMKAAYKAYEERMLVELKQEMPGLKLSQYKERIFALWQKDPSNPINQAKAAGIR